MGKYEVAFSRAAVSLYKVSVGQSPAMDFIMTYKSSTK